MCIRDRVYTLTQSLDPNETTKGDLMKIGYKRVSTLEQNLDRQDFQDVDKIFEEKTSGSTSNRPVLEEMIEFVREGDQIFVWSIDRLARNLRDLQDIIKQLNDKNVTISFLSENLTFSSDQEDPFAKLQLHLMGAFSEFERNLLKRRQREGIEKAKLRGVYKGRKKNTDYEQIKDLKKQGLGASEIARKAGVSRVTVYRVLSITT